jgi:hypothetical protein
MAEASQQGNGLYKIWKNPSKPGEPVVYLGEYRPAEGQFLFNARDLRELGFEPGNYTIRAPEGCHHLKLFSKWQEVSIPR